MPKKQRIKLSPGRPGRRVRWTFEVSADVDGAEPARAKKPAKKPVKKRQPAKRVAKRANAPAAPPSQSAHDAASPATVASSPAVVAAATNAPMPIWQPTRGQVAAISGVAVLVIALAAIPQQPSPASVTDTPKPQPVEGPDVAAEPPSPPPSADAPVAPAPTNPVTTPRALTEPAKKSPVQKPVDRTDDTPAAAPRRPAAAIDPPPRAVAESTTPAMADAKPAAPSPLSAANAPAVTITGCLEISTDGDEFRLADTEGEDAPKSRSWRTGFLRRRTAPVNLVGTGDPLALKKNVGKRVAATGVLTNRDLQVSSVRVLGSSCN